MPVRSGEAKPADSARATSDKSDVDREKTPANRPQSRSHADRALPRPRRMRKASADSCRDRLGRLASGGHLAMDEGPERSAMRDRVGPLVLQVLGDVMLRQ